MTEFIKMNFQPHSVFVGMTIKNVDPANGTHTFHVTRTVAPSIEANAADDQYNEFGVGVNLGGGIQYGRTGQAFNSPGPGTSSLLFGPTQQNGTVFTSTVASFQTYAPSNCFGSSDPPGPISGGNWVLTGFVGEPNINVGFKAFTLAPNASVRVGKFVYRMIGRAQRPRPALGERLSACAHPRRRGGTPT